MRFLIKVLITIILSFFSLESKDGIASETLTKEEAIAFTKQFIDEGKALALQHVDLTKEPPSNLKLKFAEFLKPKIAKSTARTILGRKILNDVRAQGLNVDDYLKTFSEKLIGYEVKFYGSPEKMHIFQQATYDDKTARVEISPDNKQTRVEISFSYDGKTAAVQFYIIKEDGKLKLDDLGLEGISQKINQISEIRSFYSNSEMGKNDAKIFLDWFTKEIDSYLTR